MDKKRLKAKQLFLRGKRLKDVAIAVDLPENTVRHWSRKEGWGALRKEKQAVEKERESKKPPTTKALRVSQKKAKEKEIKEEVEKISGLTGNRNAVKDGIYAKIMYETLDEAEIEFLKGLYDDEEVNLQRQHDVLCIRELRYMKKIKALKESTSSTFVHSVSKNESTTERRGATEVNDYQEEKKDISVNSVSVEDLITRYETELTRIQKEKRQTLVALKQIRAVNEKLKLDEEKIKIERERLELEKYKIYGDKDSDEQNESITSFLKAIESTIEEQKELFNDFKAEEYVDGKDKEKTRTEEV